MISAIDLAFKLGASEDSKLAQNLVMEMLRSAPEVVLRAYTNMVAGGVSASKFDALPPVVLGSVVTAIRARNKVLAVKMVREEIGCGLKEALDLVNAVEAEIDRL